jgi:hypothetical protein
MKWFRNLPKGYETGALICILLDLTEDSGSCCLDHDGNCQAHEWFTSQPSCPHGRAHEALTEMGFM